MRRGPLASRCLLGLLLGLTCLGCRNLAHRPAPADPAFVPAGSPPVATGPLRIPGPPTAAPAPPPASPVESPPLLASTPSPSPPRPAAAPPTPNPPLPSLADPPPALPSASAPATAAGVSPLRRLAQQAAATYASLDGYSARLRQREQVNGKDRPEEIMLVKFRKEPWSIYFKWVGPEGQGREVVYVQGRGDGKIHSRLAAGDVPLFPAGATFAVAPDSLLARGRSRHPITDAGLGRTLDWFGPLVDAAERGDATPGGLTYLGPQTRPEFPAPVEAVEQTIPPGREPALPRGGRRLWGFAPDSHLPVLISTRDDTGHEVEYYCYEQLQYPAHFGDDDFNPDRLWAKR
jgi:hypothetical protein